MDRKWNCFIWLIQECEKNKKIKKQGLRIMKIKVFATKWKQTNGALGSE